MYVLVLFAGALIVQNVVVEVVVGVMADSVVEANEADSKKESFADKTQLKSIVSYCGNELISS